MSDETKGKSLLENAYRLATPDDNIAYYRDFSDSYDQDFADSLGFALPTEVARVFLARRMDDQGPVADLGCGTGLVGEALHGKVSEIDGLDISTEMLSVARSKGVYNALVQIDLTKSVEGYEQAYGKLPLKTYTMATPLTVTPEAGWDEVRLLRTSLGVDLQALCAGELYTIFA